MKKGTYLAFIGLFLFVSDSKAQSKSISIGDIIPDITINNVINYPYKTVKISDFKNKLVILDFWATYCTPCLHLFPKYDSLQKKLGDKLQILLVTSESAKKATALLDRFHYTLPSATSDITLAKLFPHTSIPHEVWIKDGKVISIGYGEDVNEKTIIAAINNQLINIDIKQDNLSFNNMEPLLINGNGGKSSIYYHSLITPYIEGLRSLETYYKNVEMVHSSSINANVISLYHQAFKHLDPLLAFDNRTVIDLPDSLKIQLVRPANSNFHQWMKQYGFCYDLVLPPNYSGDLTSIMQTDLNRFFESKYDINAKIEKRTLGCLVISKVPGYQSLKSKGGDSVFQSDKNHFILKNLPINSLIMLLANQYRKLPTPIIDDTGYEEPIDLVVNANTEDLVALQNELLKSGLSITLKQREVDVIVIKKTRY
ncbi:thiol-disulfide isomerase/thioredoxin [Mucilaginibacter gracilis]|uniref:Thiol-disulfide isomerase/thioredoxin n=1 Tax=Mucilaginibacter gracilis TaxID=423350 RepID=A0A495J4R8_9SPHI|nr:TlpA disulfide reductase family protein [Mucilaginibacter gracilis]RKR83334.1 thiol-disulfide isomerase/thioredoxin [Mucilaginibacter gracilis]